MPIRSHDGSGSVDTREPPSATCASCGERLQGAYCHRCGERVLPEESARLGRYLQDAFADLTSADSALWRSLKALLVAPGLLTLAYMEGRRTGYVRPVRLFLILNVFFFLLLTFVGGQGIRGTLGAQVQALGSWAERWVEREVAQHGVEREVHKAVFNQQADTLARTLIGLMIPVWTLLLAVSFAFKRWSSVRHLVFATHFFAFLLIWSLIIVGLSILVLVAWGYVTGAPFQGSFDPVVIPLLLTGAVLYMVLALKRAYQTSWLGAITRGVLLGTVGLALTFMLYRALLFVVTIKTISL